MGAEKRMKDRNNPESNDICITSTIIHVALLMIALFMIMPTSEASDQKWVVITNNHTNYLSVRCFAFDIDFRAQHLKPQQNYTFSFKLRKIFPSATMFNCSTNMGAFVAYKYDYECSSKDYKSCEWKYDENKTYQWLPKSQNWKAMDYNPNYESLSRGGVVKGYYSN